MIFYVDAATKRPSIASKCDKMSQSNMSQMLKKPMIKRPTQHNVPRDNTSFKARRPLCYASHATRINQPLGSRIHGTFPQAHLVTGSIAPIHRPIWQQDPWHPICRPIEYQDPRLLSAGSLSSVQDPLHLSKGRIQYPQSLASTSHLSLPDLSNIMSVTPIKTTQHRHWTAQP